MVSPQQKKRAVEDVVRRGLCSVRRACQILNLGRTRFLYEARKATEKAQRLQQLIVELSLKYPRYGYRRITILLRHRGWMVKVSKSCSVSVAKKASGSSHSLRRENVAVLPVRSNNALKMMTLVDEYSRFCLAIRVERNLSSKEVIAVLAEAIGQYGRPKHIRSDNGPEFIAQVIQHWLQEHKD